MRRTTSGRSRPSHRRLRAASRWAPTLPAVTGAVAIVVMIAVLFAVTRPPGPSGPAASPTAPPGPARPARSLAPGPLVPQAGALFGAWVEPTAGFTVSDLESSITQLEHELGRKLAIDQLYAPWAAPLPLAVAGWDLSHGRIPMVSWGGAPTDLIAEGSYDAQIRARALQLRALHGPVMLRWFAEMDGTANAANAVSPESFIAAWRHIHEIFTSVGATNVLWVWCPNAFNFATGYAQEFYPGKDFVDWVGADGYNWAPGRPGSQWTSFAEIFSSFYQWGLSSGKPLLIGEYGVLEGAPGQKAAWFKQADRELRTRFAAIRAVVYFDSDHQNFDWRVTTSPTAFSAFRAFATDPYFRARPAV
jgi:hypothetical protein